MPTLKIILSKAFCQDMPSVMYRIASKGKALAQSYSLVDLNGMELSDDLTLGMFQISATLASGEKLPSWLTFDAKKAVFTV
jgi:hypothetical protein